MKFAAATMFPGLANMSQNGTEPSPKSIQSVPLSGSPQGPLASAGAAGRSMAAATITAARSTFRIAGLCSRKLGEAGTPASPSAFVERAVDLGDLLRFGVLELRRVVGADLRLAAEAFEVGELDVGLAVAGADLLERPEQALLG